MDFQDLKILKINSSNYVTIYCSYQIKTFLMHLSDGSIILCFGININCSRGLFFNIYMNEWNESTRKLSFLKTYMILPSV